MARSGVPTTPPIFREINYGALVRQQWGDEWLRPDIVYRFSNGRTFDEAIPGALYNGTNTS